METPAGAASEDPVDGAGRGVTDRDHVGGEPLPVITDEFMRERLAGVRGYTAALLRKTEKLRRPEHDSVIWEHGRRNMALAENGVLAVVLPVNSGPEPGNLAGLGIFAAPPDEVAAIMDHDPAVAAGLFSYEIHPVRGFPGASLPG